jgi:NADPH:quinone reductase-like Zn-dependent oxidoreductase
VLVEVRHVSVNRGETVLARRADPGTVLGFDLAGVVVRTAGGGPAVGERVAAFSPGAWAERVAVAPENLAVVPDGVDLAEAAALPMAGFTALRTLRTGGSLLGRRVLITGASGGVGRFAVQLAALAGAFVVASVGSPERGKGLAGLGAHQVVTGLDQVTDPVDLVLDTVGGSHFVAAYGLLAPGGNLQSIGWASGEPAVLPPGALFSPGPARTISSFGDAERPGPDIAVLLRLLAEGRLSAEVGWRGSWERAGDAFGAILGRRVAGKAVLDVG